MIMNIKMKLKLPLFAAFLAGSCAVPCLAQVPEMKTFEDSLAYVVGVDIAKNLTQMGVNTGLKKTINLYCLRKALPWSCRPSRCG
jgi:hypothetical protein